jgi:hypothetical protein
VRHALFQETLAHQRHRRRYPARLIVASSGRDEK